MCGTTFQKLSTHALVVTYLRSVQEKKDRNLYVAAWSRDSGEEEEEEEVQGQMKMDNNS